MSEKIVDKVKKRITDLEQAIQRLDFVKRHLNQNSSEIKTQIHNSISRHLETLRHREVWLLDQVDTVLVGKEEVLQRQQARLNKALGILHSSLNHASDSGDDDDETAARHLVQALEELNATELKAEETPYIAFRADQVGLRESILSYGRVDANGMPLLSAFADEDKPSASLPRHVEEYEDSEHHLFYKALQEGKANGANIRVTMPKLSARVEDWLQRPMLHLSASAPAMAELSSPASETAAGAAGTPVSQTTCAIQNWLSEIKHNPDLEDDDDFEIVDHSGSSQRESPLEEDAKPPVSLNEAEVLDMFSHIPRDRRQWLLKGGAARSSSAAEEDLRAFFRHIPQDSSMWLATARKQLESLDELKRGGWFHHIPTETTTWLRRAHDKRSVSLSAAAVPDMFTHISRDKSMWLKKEPARAAVAEEAENAGGEGGKGQKVAAVEVVGGKGWRSLGSPAPLPSIPNLMKEYLACAPSAMDCWLLRPQGQAGGRGCKAEGPEAELSDLPGIQKYLTTSANPSSWLASPRGGEEREAEPQPQPSSASGNPAPQFFAHISSNKSDWLRSEQQHGGCNSNPAKAIDLQKAAKTSISQWLRPQSLSTESSTTCSSPLDSLIRSFSRLGSSHWLAGGRPRLDSESTESSASWKVLPDSPQSSSASTSTVSLQSLTTSGRHQIPALNLASWVFQNGQ